nr:hypothetical protein [Tanacetum cinerariifolium]
MNTSECVSKVYALECNFLSPTLKERDFQMEVKRTLLVDCIKKPQKDVTVSILMEITSHLLAFPMALVYCDNVRIYAATNDSFGFDYIGAFFITSLFAQWRALEMNMMDLCVLFVLAVDTGYNISKLSETKVKQLVTDILKRTRIKAKTDKTKHGMEKREKSKSTKSKSTKVKVKDGAETKEIRMGRLMIANRAFGCLWGGVLRGVTVVGHGAGENVLGKINSKGEKMGFGFLL